MSYFTTMNLPAPAHGQFLDLLKQYGDRPDAAVLDFEAALRRFFDVPAVSTWSNCFTSIALALRHASAGRAPRVVVAGLAYRRTADIVLWAGLQPLFVDNSAHDLALDLSALRRTLSREPVGCILAQHPMVHLLDIEALSALADEFQVPVVFDSVEATGASYRGHRLGRFGVAEAFSLHPSKVINAAEGGVLTFGDEAQYRQFGKSMTDLGLWDATSGRPAMFQLEPLHAVMGLASLSIYNEVRDRHRSHFERYRDGLAGSRSLKLVQYDGETDPNYKSVLVQIVNPSTTFRSRLMSHLEARRIGARAYYAPLHPLTQSAELPAARALAEQYMILPIGHSVSLTDIDSICACIADFERQAGSEPTGGVHA